MMGPAEKMPQGPAQPNAKHAGQNGSKVLGVGMKLTSGTGTQKSMNPAKSQPNTMKYLR